MSQNPPENVPEVASHDLLCWLRGKLAAAEQSLKSREEMANEQPITKEEWEWLRSLPSTIAGRSRKTSKAKHEEEISRHKRIAVKCRHEVAMFRAVIAALSAR
jgi:hypothetical protein